MVEAKSKMIYRFLGKSGLKVSALGFGNWVNSHKNDPQVEEMTYQCMMKAYELGINYFDTAEIYGNGVAETQMGNAIKRAGWERKDFVISTKIFKVGNEVNDMFLSRKHIIEGLTNSLKRLQLDYVDVVFAHRYDEETPIEEIVRAFNYLIEHGKAFYWGTSMWTPQQIMEAHDVCSKLGLIRPIVEQPEYNMMRRERIEVELVPLFDKFGLGTTIWSPLAGGFLTGKYNDGLDVPDSRYGQSDRLTPDFKKMIIQGYLKEGETEVIGKMKKLGELAKELDCSQSQLALAWVMKNTDISVCLFGATKVTQVEENIKALEVYEKWTPEIEAKIEEIMKNEPTPLTNFRKWAPNTPRRKQLIH